ncbi:hypothetical protein [Paenibacillus agricola]|uniref:Fungal lipase-like domain-containing protein n=1 Tax=Paenibacillus agricola TaxID=2716264 RepID=A0ABX0J622_9BACL|nr:hypothetical protein [Paenibacillus agricola]NHN29531.1 hypothetical protein [Paenibacillus agricola]
MGLPITKVNLFLLAGVATAPLFMENVRLALVARLEQAGCKVNSELLFPYGDWSRKLLPQLLELRHDLGAARTRPLRSIGGTRVAAAVAARVAAGVSETTGAGCSACVAAGESETTSTGGAKHGGKSAVSGRSSGEAAYRAEGGDSVDGATLSGSCSRAGEPANDAASGARSLTLLLGHSGGGVAAVHAAGILAAEPALPCGAARPLRVVQIGSPKCPIPAWLQDSLLYASAINAQGRPSDPVTLLGSWRVWQRSRVGLPMWRSLAPTSPLTNIRLRLLGGHPDYFRESSPFINQQGLSNLEITVQSVMDWLNSTFEQKKL